MLSFSRFRILDTVFARSCGALLARLRLCQITLAQPPQRQSASTGAGVESVVDLIYAAKLYAN